MIHKIRDIKFQNNYLLINIDGKDYSFPLKMISNKLLSSSDIERNTCKVSPSGYGIHWPLVDEDLSIDGLLKLKINKPAQRREKVS